MVRKHLGSSFRGWYNWNIISEDEQEKLSNRKENQCNNVAVYFGIQSKFFSESLSNIDSVIKYLQASDVLPVSMDVFRIKERFLGALFLDNKTCEYFCTNKKDLRHVKQKIIHLLCTT